MAELVLELRGLELSPAEQRGAVERLARGVFEELAGRGMPPAEILTVSTPRRVGLVCRGFAVREATRGASRRGSRRPLRELLVERLPRILGELDPGLVRLDRDPRRGPELAGRRDEVPLPAEIDWGGGRRGGRRPLDGVVAVLDGEVLPLELAGVTAGRETVGHPALSPALFAVASGDDYLAALRERGIEPLYARRVEALAEALRARAAGLGGELRLEPRLLRRAAALVEMPGGVGGEVEPEHLTMPIELYLAALRRLPAFAVVTPGGELLPRFVAPVDRLDDPAGRVRAGLETAVAGLLADARFHWGRDRRTPLAERAGRLDRLTFHPRLGTYAEKVHRLRALVAFVVGELGAAFDEGAARDAVELLKADLGTATVRENDRLRGIAGGCFAREEGYVEAVWRAIAEQYRPAAADDEIPAGRVGRLVAFADRLDTVVGLVGLGLRPGRDGSDPCRLRTLVDGLLRLLAEGGLELDLDLVAARAILLYGDRFGGRAGEISEELGAFVDERLRLLLGRRGFAFDEIEGALAVPRTSLPELLARVTALKTLRREPAFAALVVAARRIDEIVHDLPDRELREDRLGSGAERALHEVLQAVRVEADARLAERRPEDALRAMAGVLPALDAFFADVLVMDEDLERRHDRVALLQAVRRLFGRVGRLRDLTPAMASASDGS